MTIELDREKNAACFVAMIDGVEYGRGIELWNAGVTPTIDDIVTVANALRRQTTIILGNKYGYSSKAMSVRLRERDQEDLQSMRKA